jgi:hypothetical protein
VSSSRDREHNENVSRARQILGGLEVRFEELTELGKRLKTALYFAYARQIFARVRRLPEAAAKQVYWVQQHALCTYKDQDLPYTERADRALEILAEVQVLNETTDQETLGLAGAIFKYKWAADGQRSNLERSLAYYLRGYGQGVEKDYGYTAVNAAFVMDLIAFQEETESRKGVWKPSRPLSVGSRRARSERTLPSAFHLWLARRAVRGSPSNGGFW